jgi:glycosyltransferase involved in cell wall biosynthesis
VAGVAGDRNPRVLHIDTEPTFRGGEAQALLLIEALAGRGDVGLLAARGGELARRAGALKRCRLYELPNGSRSSPRAWWAMWRAVRDFRPDILHAHTSHGHALAWMASPSRVPIVATRRVDFPIPRTGMRGAKYRSRRTWSVAISGAIDGILAGAGVPAERRELIPSGIDTGRFAAVEDTPARREARRALLAEIGADESAFIIGSVGALVDHKGHRYLVEAARLLRERALEAAASGRDTAEAEAGFGERPRVHVVVAGEGERRGEIEAQLGAAGLGEGDSGAPVTFHLLGQRGDVPALLAAFDLFVMPSRLEGLGTTLADALWMDLPIVASRVGGIPEMIVDGDNGLLVPPEDPVALADALERLLMDPAPRARLRARARASLATSPFLAPRMVAGYFDLYARILAAGR